MQTENKDNIALDLDDVGRFATDDNLIQLGTNAVVGNIMMFMKGRKRIRLSDTELKKRHGGVFGGLKKLVTGSKTWRYDDSPEVWIKFISYKKNKNI